MMTIAAASPMAPEPDADARLLAAWVERGDRAALAELFHRLARPALAVARRLAGDDLAEDAVQDGFLAAMRGARPRRTATARAWVLAVVANAARDQRRAAERRRRRELAAVPPPPPPPDDPGGELGERLLALLPRLPMHERAALELRVIDGLTSGEAASALGRRPGTVDVQVHRGLGRLREWLGLSMPPTALAAALHAGAPAAEPSPALLSRLDALAAAGPAPAAAGGAGLAGALALAGGIAAVGWYVLPSSSPPPPAAVAGEAPTMPTPAPVAADPDAPWTGRAGDLLRYVGAGDEWSFAVDIDWLRRHASARRPSSILHDPRWQPGLAEARRQLGLWARASPHPDWAAAWDAAAGFAFSGNRPDEGCLAIDAGSAAAGIHALWRTARMDRQDALAVERTAAGERIIEGDPARAARSPAHAAPSARSQPGAMREVFRVGELRGGQWLLMNNRMPPPVDAAAPPSLPRDSGAWMRVNIGPWLRQFAALDGDRRDPVGLARWFGPDWRTAQPQATARLLPDAQAWRIATDLDGIRLPLHPIAPALSGLLAMPGWGHAAIGIDPELVRGWIAAGGIAVLPPPQPLSDPGPAAAAGPWISGLTGDAILSIQPGSPLPGFALVLGLTPAEGQQAAVDALLARWGGARGQPDGGRPVWQLASPAGLVRVALGADRLVATTALDTAPWFAATAGAPDVHASFLLDMAAVRPWVPMLAGIIETRMRPEASLSAFDGLFIADGLRSLESAFQNGWQEESGAAGRVPGSTQLQDAVEEKRRWLAATTPGAWLRARARRVLERPGLDAAALRDVRRRALRPGHIISEPWTHGEDEGAARALLLLQRACGPAFDIDRHVALFSKDGGRIRGAVRTADGWIGLERWNQLRHFSAGMVPAQIQDDVGQPMELIYPGRLDAVQPCALPELPRMERRSWFPREAILALADHIPDWRLSAAPTPSGWRIDESGWPLHLMMGAAIAMPAISLPADSIHYLQRDRLEADAVRQRQRDKIAALTAIQPKLQGAIAAWRTSLPGIVSSGDSTASRTSPPLSHLLRTQGVDPATMRAFFSAPPAWSAIDDLGRYLPCDGWGIARTVPELFLTRMDMRGTLLWVVPIEPGWVALLFADGSAPILTSYPTPATPQAGDPKPGPVSVEKPRAKQTPPPKKEAGAGERPRRGADDF